MIKFIRQYTGKRFLAASWFALFGFLAASIFFLRPNVRFHALCMYVLLPAACAGIAGFFWGGSILDGTATRSYANSMLRGIGVTAGAFAIFAVVFAVGLPLLERGWSLKQSAGIFITTLTLGLLMVGPMILLAGVIAGITLHLLGRLASTKTDDRAV